MATRVMNDHLSLLSTPEIDLREIRGREVDEIREINTLNGFNIHVTTQYAFCAPWPPIPLSVTIRSLSKGIS